jgi:hypothetical protein
LADDVFVTVVGHEFGEVFLWEAKGLVRHRLVDVFLPGGAGGLGELAQGLVLLLVNGYGYFELIGIQIVIGQRFLLN